jgi:2-dehydro-3-deoxyphosphooctonate aldolase (KDO 8-P synthase)
VREVHIGSVKVGGNHPFALIAGPCVIEGRDETLSVARELAGITASLSIPLIFKSSYDKANRTSLTSYRGPGLTQGLKILGAVKEELGVPVLSDVHRFEEIGPASQVLDVLQIPAFLCRQTDFVIEVARTGRAINIKKGQFLAPEDIRFVVEKVTSVNNRRFLITERGTTFGYNNLVADMRALVIMRDLGYPVVFDATHSVQLPGGESGVSGGESRFVSYLARAATAVGIDALFLEVHGDPRKALCDGANSLPLDALPGLLEQARSIDRVAKNAGTAG